MRDGELPRRDAVTVGMALRAHQRHLAAMQFTGRVGGRSHAVRVVAARTVWSLAITGGRERSVGTGVVASDCFLVAGGALCRGEGDVVRRLDPGVAVGALEAGVGALFPIPEEEARAIGRLARGAFALYGVALQTAGRRGGRSGRVRNNDRLEAERRDPESQGER